MRKNENIAWKKTSPEGGQSGIISWGEKLFFTINKPLDIPPFEELESSLTSAKEAFGTTKKMAIASQVLHASMVNAKVES